MDVLGRDDEVSSLHAFLDRPGDGGMAGARPRGRGGDREVDDLARRCRGCARARASRPLVPTRRGRAGRRVCRAGRPARRRTRGSGRRAGSSPSSCARDRVAAPGGRGRAGRLPNARRGRPQRAARARRAPADPARGRRRPVAGCAVENRPGVRVAAIAGREHPAASRPQAWGRHRGVRARACAGQRPDRAQARRPAQSGRVARDPAAEARPVVRAADAAAPPRSRRAATPSSRSSSPVPSATDVDPTQPLPVPETLEALVRARLDGLPDETRRALLLACTHGRLTPAQLDARRTRARVRRPRDRARGRGDPFHAPAARLRALSGRFAERSAPRARTIGRDRRRSARSRAPSRACSG